MNTPLSQADSDGLLYLSQPISSNLHQRHGYSPISEEDIHNNEDSGLPNNATDDDLFPAEPPKDAWNIAYFIFFALGVGMLFPWNVFINANEYFRARLRGSPFVDNYANFFSIGYMISNVLWLAIALRAQSHARPMKRIINSLVLNALIFLACLTLTRVKGLAPQTDFALNIFMVVICGASTAYLQNGVFGLASIFPSIYVQAVMSGQGLAGSAVAISQIMTLLVKSHDDLSVEAASYSAFLYFTFAFLVLTLCISGSLCLKTLPVYKYYTGQAQLAREESDNLYLENETFVQSKTQAGDSISSATDASTTGFNTQMEPALRFRVDSWSIFRRLFPLSLAVFLVFFVTLSLFPAISASVHSVVAKGDKPTRFQAEFFTPVAFLIFSLGDWLGKALPGFPALPLPACLFGRQPDGRSRRWNYAVISGPWTVFTLTIARFLFIPLFLFSNTVVVVGSETLERSLPLWVNNDVLFYIIMAVFAVSNGWLGSLSMMHGPQLVRDYEREIAGTVMVFCLTIGLAAGSIFSFFLRSSMCHWCDPFSS